MTKSSSGSSREASTAAGSSTPLPTSTPRRSSSPPRRSRSSRHWAREGAQSQTVGRRFPCWSSRFQWSVTHSSRTPASRAAWTCWARVAAESEEQRVWK